MKEMTAARELHRQTELITSLDRIAIAHAPAGMNHGGDAVAGSQTHRIVKREEAITGQNRSLRFLTCSFQGNPRGAHAIHLPGTHAKALPILGHNDGVGANVTHQSPGKFQVLLFLRCGRTLAGHGPVGRGDRLVIEVLNQETTQDLRT